MVKYWNAGRVRRLKKKRERKEARSYEQARQARKGHVLGTRSNVRPERMLDALGAQIRRDMVRRLRQGGAMSVSKLSKSFGVTIAATMKHLRLLEESGIITTHKRGRIRFCVYNPPALKELGDFLKSRYFTF